MARTHYVAKRRVGSRGEYALRCTACGGSIEYGDPYKWVKVKRSYGGVKMSFHPDCVIKHVHVSTSRLAVIWDAQRELDFSGCEDAESCAQVLEELASIVRDVEAEYRESVEAMEEGFGHRTYQADELEERADALEAWADELESWDGSDVDEPEASPLTGDVSEDEQAEWDTFVDDLRDSAQALADECPA